MAKKVISDLLSTQAPTASSATVLERVAELTVTEVSKEVNSITGIASTTASLVEVAQAVAERTRCFGALLPILGKQNIYTLTLSSCF